MAVTENDVLDIMHSNLSAADVTPFLVTAQVIIGDDLATSDYSASRKDQIEKWLAAHLTAMGKDHSGRIASEDVDGTYMARYGGEFGLALNHTKWGQVVLQLDKDGLLTQPEPDGGQKLPALFDVISAGSS